MSISLGAITLPDLFWSDEHDWTPVAQSLAYAENGQLIREESARLKGREITLEGDEGYGWVDRNTVEELRALQLAANASPMTLTIHGTAYSVAWRRPNPMSARPVRGPVSDPDASERYALTLRFIEI